MTEATQITRYLLVGGAITLADAALYNWLTGRERAIPRITANVLSTTFGMALGFTLHFFLVFQPNVPRMPSRLLAYLVTVGCSVYIVQNIVIHLCTGKLAWAAPLWPDWRVHQTAASTRAETFDRLAGKALAAAAGMIWNFLFFKWVVYA